MALEERFVDGHILETNNTFVGYDFYDSIDQDKGIPMGQELKDLSNVIHRFHV